MNNKCILAAIAAALFCVSAGAAEVAFTGGAGGTSRDLSLADNWDGGSVPSGVGATGVVNVATFGTSYTVSSAVALNGLKFANATSMVTVGGESTLSLGVGGLSLSGTGGISLNAPMEVTVASTWDIGGGKLVTSGMIAGVSDLAIKGISTFSHDPLPGYGGKITYSISSETTVTISNEKWADAVSIMGNKWFLNPSETTYLSTLLSGGRLGSPTQWVHYGLCSEENKTLVVDGGSSIYDTSGEHMCLLGGTLRVDGGSVNVMHHCTVGDAVGTAIATSTKYPVAPMTLDVRSGSLSSIWMLVGSNYGVQNTENGSFHSVVSHSGGTVTLSSLEIGGWEVDSTLRSGGYSVPRHSEYVLEGENAVLDVSYSDNYKRNYGISLSANVDRRTNPKCMTPGVFTQKSGTARVSRVQFGAYCGLWGVWNDAVPGYNGYGYGLFSLRGGTFELGGAGFALGRNWNNGSVTQSVYDIEFAGGTLKPTAGMNMVLACRVPDRGTTFNWNTAAGTNSVYAPLSGDGILRKVGSGALVLSDAVDFRGSVAVSEGTLAVIGRPSDTPASPDCLVYTADSLAGLEEGASVMSWTDTAGTLSMSAQPDSGYGFGAPTFVTAASSVFNGHAAVRFTASDSAAQALQFSAADNPIGGETNVTIAIVFNPVAQGLSPYENNYLWRYNRILFGTPGGSDLLLSWMSGRRLVFGGGFAASADVAGASPKTPSAPVALDAPHVVLATLRDKEFILDLDGDVSVTNSFAASEKPYPRHRTETGASDGKSLYIGASTIDNSPAFGRSFIGDIAEIRIYRGKALDDAERRGVMYSLMEKYQGGDNALAYRKAMGAFEVGAEFDAGPAPAAVTPEPTAYAWSADSLSASLADGDKVTLWTTAGGKQATADVATAPTFATSAMNGHPAVRFDAMQLQKIGIESGQLPYSTDGGAAMDGSGNLQRFSIAVVFQSSVEGKGTAHSAKGLYITGDDHVGIVGNLYGSNAWQMNAAITWDEGGSVGTCSGTGDGQYYNSPRRPVRLDDGKPHVAILSRDFDTGVYSVMIDGLCHAATMRVTTGLGKMPHKFFIGALTRLGTGCFTGDIGEVRFYEKALSESEMSDITEYWMQKYGIRRLHKGAYDLAALDRFGMGATNISVSAGARLLMPKSSTAPFEIKSGVTLQGEGAFEGSYRFCDGGVVDFATLPADMEDVQIADGARVVLCDDVLSGPIDGSNISSISGNVVFDVSGVLDRLPICSRLPILAVSPDVVAPDATFGVSGGTWDMFVRYDADKGGLVLCRQMGVSIIVF